MTYYTDEEEKHRQEIAKSLKKALRNHPPSKEDMYEVINHVKRAYPELTALRKLMDDLPDTISEDWWRLLPTYDIYLTVEEKLNTDPFDDETATDAFAYIMWLSTNLICARAAIWSLGEIGDIKANEPLKQIKDNRVTVRREIKKALGKIQLRAHGKKACKSEL